MLSFCVFAQNSLTGLWEGSDRFVEIAEDNFRIVLKPYYGFVWEDTGSIPSAILEQNKNEFEVQLKYAGTKEMHQLMLAQFNDNLYLNYLCRLEIDSASKIATANFSLPHGFYRAASTATSILLYPEQKKDEFFAYYFEGQSYARIRYWAADVLKRESLAHFELVDGSSIAIPKFIEFDQKIFTCITSTGTQVRNFEKGRYEFTEEGILFKPEKIVYKETVALYRKPIPFELSDDGSLIALGEPYLKKSEIVYLDQEIEVHNGKRRPLRKPVFGYMELDFRWDEIEKIRNKN